MQTGAFYIVQLQTICLHNAQYHVPLTHDSSAIAEPLVAAVAHSSSSSSSLQTM